VKCIIYFSNNHKIIYYGKIIFPYFPFPLFSQNGNYIVKDYLRDCCKNYNDKILAFIKNFQHFMN